MYYTPNIKIFFLQVAACEHSAGLRLKPQGFRLCQKHVNVVIGMVNERISKESSEDNRYYVYFLTCILKVFLSPPIYNFKIRLLLSTLLKKCLHMQKEMEPSYLDPLTNTLKLMLSDRWGEIGETVDDVAYVCCIKHLKASCI